MFFYIGTALFSYYTAQPDLLPEELKVAGEGDKVFPYFIATGLPPGITGLLIAAIFAAGMSTVSTSLNSTATIVLTDYYKRYFNKEAGEKTSMKVLYISSFLMGIAGIAIALSLVGVESAPRRMVVTGFDLQRRNAGSIPARIHLKAVQKAGCRHRSHCRRDHYYMDEPCHLKSPFHTNLTIVFGTVAIFLVGFLITYV